MQASASSFYRRHLARRKQVGRRGARVKPEGPNQVWMGPDLQVCSCILPPFDVYSRKIVGWKLSFQVEIANGTAGPAWAHKHSPLRSRISDEGQIDGRGHLGYQTPTDNAWIAFFRTFKYDWLRFHLHIPSTGRPDCFLHSQLQRRTLSRGNTVCHASSEAWSIKRFFTTDKVERRRLGSAA